MRKALLIMAAALMTLAQCRKQETVPATPSANTIKMTVTAGPGAKTDITDEGKITWTSGDVLYVSDGAKWLGSLTLVSGAGNVSGTFTGTIQEIGDGVKTCHFFYLGHDNGMAEPSGTTAASISFASQDGSRNGALKYHLGHGSAEVTVSGGEATGAVAMRTEIAIAHLKLTMNSDPYPGSVTMGGTGISNTLSVSPDGSFSGSGTDGITIAAGTSGDRYVTLIPTGTSSVDVSFSGSATGSLTFGHGIQANNLYGMADGIEVALTKVPVTGVTLNKTELSLEVGGTATLTATVDPDYATDKSVTWSSNATGVATVSDAGVVTAVAAGTATITVTATNGTEATDDDKTATCAVTVTAAHEYVDLGLPSGRLWATCNVGADSPEKYGDYFMWGSTTNGGDSNCSWAKCPGNGGSSSYNATAIAEWDGSNLTNNVLKPEVVDAARANWGGDWRMPTSAEWKELYDNTTSIWTTENGVYGQKFASKTDSSKYIFLPAAGRRDGTVVKEAGSIGNFWSSSLYSSDPGYAYRMSFYSGGVYPQHFYDRYFGLSVRPVR